MRHSRLDAQIAAHASWAQTVDRSARTAPARAAAQARFEALVDPEGVMSPAQRVQAAESARKRFYAEMQKRSAQARRLKRRPTGGAPDGGDAE
jgi:hypothetical protein